MIPLVGLLLFAIAAAKVSATPGVALDLERLIDDSSLVITGHPPIGRESDIGAESFPVSIDGVLKGNNSLQTITLHSTGFNRLPRGELLMFLKGTGNDFQPTYPPYTFLVISPTAGPRNASAIDSVIDILQSTLQSNQPVSVRARALFYLKTVRTQHATDALLTALNNNESTISIDAAAALLERDNLSGIAIASQVLSRQRSAAPNQIHNVDSAISEGVKSDLALPLLRQMSTSASVEQRRSAGSCLAHINSSKGIPLAVGMLSDSDSIVRFFGVLTLAQVTEDQKWQPNMETFLADEDRYLQYWRSWASAQENSSRVSKPPGSANTP